jgi:hypothetical protein
MPTTTGKKLKYALIIALGKIPCNPTELKTTMIIGAIANMGMVCDAIAQGITLISIALLYTIPIANKIPSPVPIAKPRRVELKVIHP